MLTITISGERGEGKSAIAALIALALHTYFIDFTLTDSDEPDAKDLYQDTMKTRKYEQHAMDPPKLPKYLKAIRERIEEHKKVHRPAPGETCGVVIKTQRLNRMPTAVKPQYYRCGICDHYHDATWNGDCRENQNRLTIDDIIVRHGEHGWDEVDMPAPLPTYYRCGHCAYYHVTVGNGDCCKDKQRYTRDDIDAKHGPDGWQQAGTLE